MKFQRRLRRGRACPCCRSWRSPTVVARKILIYSYVMVATTLALAPYAGWLYTACAAGLGRLVPPRGAPAPQPGGRVIARPPTAASRPPRPARLTPKVTPGRVRRRGPAQRQPRADAPVPPVDRVPDPAFRRYRRHLAAPVGQLVGAPGPPPAASLVSSPRLTHGQSLGVTRGHPGWRSLAEAVAFGGAGTRAGRNPARSERVCEVAMKLVPMTSRRARWAVPAGAVAVVAAVTAASMATAAAASPALPARTSRSAALRAGQPRGYATADERHGGGVGVARHTPAAGAAGPVVAAVDAVRVAHDQALVLRPRPLPARPAGARWAKPT